MTSKSTRVWSDDNGRMYVLPEGCDRGIAVSSFEEAVNQTVTTIGHGFVIHYLYAKDVPEKWWPKRRKVSSKEVKETPKKSTRKPRQSIAMVIDIEDADPFFGS